MAARYGAVFDLALSGGLQPLPRSQASAAERQSDVVDEIGDDRPDALAGIEAVERQRRLAAAITALPERQRAAVALTYTTGLANAAAAEVMEISVKAFESLLVRAKKELRQELSGAGEEWIL